MMARPARCHRICWHRPPGYQTLDNACKQAPRIVWHERRLRRAPRRPARHSPPPAPAEPCVSHRETVHFRQAGMAAGGSGKNHPCPPSISVHAQKTAFPCRKQHVLVCGGQVARAGGCTCRTPPSPPSHTPNGAVSCRKTALPGGRRARAHAPASPCPRPKCTLPHFSHL